MLKFLCSITFSFLLYIPIQANSFPLLDQGYLDMSYAASAITQRELLLRELLKGAGLPPDEIERDLPILLSEDQVAQGEFVSSILSNPNRSVDKEFIALIVKAHLENPGVVTFFEEHRAISPSKIRLTADWAYLAYATERALFAPLPLFPFASENEKYLKGYKEPLDETLLKELKNDIVKYSANPDSEGRRDLKPLIKIMLAQQYDEDFVSQLVENKLFPGSSSLFMNEMCWQSDERYLADALEYCETLNLDSMAKHEANTALQDVTKFLSANINEDQVKDFIIETLTESPSTYYPYLPRIAEQLQLADSLSVDQKSRLTKQARILMESGQIMLELQYVGPDRAPQF